MPELAVALVTAEGASPARWMVFLHGILGSGSNWRTFAKQFVDRRPRWGAALVDLRNHGASQGFAPPHTLSACAADVRSSLGKIPGPVTGLLGHSFGGKVVLEYLRSPGDVEIAWVLDSTPGARPDGRGSESTLRVVALLERMPRRFEAREAFIDEVLRDGHERSFAMWLAMLVKPAREGGGYELRVDLAAIRAMLDDYFATDEWDMVEHCPIRALHLVVGGRSSVLTPDDVARAEAVAQVHVIPEAGHWLHADAPVALLDIVTKGTPE